MSDIKQVTMTGEDKNGVDKILMIECDCNSIKGNVVVRFPSYDVAVSRADLLDAIEFLGIHQ